MWETIGSIILKYWVELLLGLVVAGGGFIIKRYIKLSKEDREKGQKEFYESLQNEIIKNNNEIKTASQNGDKELQKQINMLKNETDDLKIGVLSIQGRQFKENCERLLEPSHNVTLQEWEDIDEDYKAYKALGGNHRGDLLYNTLKRKVEKTLLIPSEE